jgi:ADP-heptose:LPS heptosyltransferase
MKAIRAHYAGAHITLMTTAPFEALAMASGYVDAVYIDKRPKWYDLFGWLGLRAWLNAQDFTQVYDLQNSERSALYQNLFTTRPNWCGADRNDPVRRKMHVFDALRAQLLQAGISQVAVDDLSWIKADVPALPQPYVLVVPGCSPTRIIKRWPPENYIAICQWLVERGFTPVLIGTKDEADVITQIKSAVPQAVDLTGQTSLFQIAVLARGAAAAVGNDTGPIQMIGPTGCKTLGLYPGFSNPARHGPLGANVHTLQGQVMTDITITDVKTRLQTLLG